MKEFLLATLIYSGAGSIDTLSTKYALSKCPNCYEMNPIGGVGIKLGMSTALAGIEKTQTKKTRRVMRITWLAINVGLAGWNLHQMRKYGYPNN